MTEDDDEAQERRAREQLARRIRSAFASVPRPEPPLTMGTGPFEDDVERALAGKTSDEVGPDDAREVRMNLWLLTPEAYRYYLPRLLELELDPSVYVEGLGEFAFLSLVPPEDASAKSFAARVEPLDDEQRAAIAGFVKWFAGEEEFVSGAERALGYWHQ